MGRKVSKKARTFDEIVNIIGQFAFGATGLTALASVFFGATHQLFTAGVCLVMVLVMHEDSREDDR